MTTSPNQRSLDQITSMKFKEIEGRQVNQGIELQRARTTLESLLEAQNGSKANQDALHTDVETIKTVIEQINAGLEKFARVVNGPTRQQRMEGIEDGSPIISGGFDPHARRTVTYKGPPTNLTFALKDDETWNQFKNKFLMYCDLQQYPDDIAKRVLYLCMKGNALVSVEGLNHRGGESLAVLMDQYEEKFVPPSASGLAQVRYEQARQGKYEDITQWHARLQTIWLRAYPSQVRNGDEVQLIRHFMLNCNRQSVRDNIQRSAPKTYAAALISAQMEQAVVDNKRYADGEVQPMDIGAMKELNINAIDPATAKCYNCSKIGHISKDCRQPRNSSGSSYPGRSVSALTRSKPRRDHREGKKGKRVHFKFGAKQYRFPRRRIQEIFEFLETEEAATDQDEEEDEVSSEEEEEITVEDDDGNNIISTIQDFQ